MRYFQFWAEIGYKNASLHLLLILKSQGCLGPYKVNLFSPSLWCLLLGILEKRDDGLFQIPLCQGIKMRYPITIKAPLRTHRRMQEINIIKYLLGVYWVLCVSFVTICYDLALRSTGSYCLFSNFSPHWGFWLFLIFRFFFYKLNIFLWKEFVRSPGLMPILERRHGRNCKFIEKNITWKATATVNSKG